MRGGRLVIGVVAYVSQYPYDSSKWHVVTDCGMFCSDDILERREPKEPS
jgi:hypothetical protein